MFRYMLIPALCLVALLSSPAAAQVSLPQVSSDSSNFKTSNEHGVTVIRYQPSRLVVAPSPATPIDNSETDLLQAKLEKSQAETKAAQASLQVKELELANAQATQMAARRRSFQNRYYFNNGGYRLARPVTLSELYGTSFAVQPRQRGSFRRPTVRVSFRSPS